MKHEHILREYIKKLNVKTMYQFLKKLNKYFTDITEDDKKEIKEDESDVIDFLCKNL